MAYYLGIDPGQKGALAVVDEQGKAIALHDMPSNSKQTVALIESFPSISRAAIEKPFPGDKMGKIQCLTFGMDIGDLRGILLARYIPFCMVKPQDWQRVFGVTGKSRGNDSIGQCLKLYPNAPLIVNSKRMDGRSDALLIARWVWRQELARSA